MEPVNSGNGEAIYRPIKHDDSLVQKALGAWATAINQQIVWDTLRVRIAQKDIALSQEEVKQYLGEVIVWKDMNDDLKSTKNTHLMIRQIDSDFYEWMQVRQSKGTSDEDVGLYPYAAASGLSKLRFAAGGSEERCLTEICSVFAEQQIQFWQSGTMEKLQQIQEYSDGPESDKNNVGALFMIKIRTPRLYRAFDDLQGIRRREQEQSELSERDRMERFGFIQIVMESTSKEQRRRQRATTAEQSHFHDLEDIPRQMIVDEEQEGRQGPGKLWPEL